MHMVDYYVTEDLEMVEKVKKNTLTFNFQLSGSIEVVPVVVVVVVVIFYFG